MWLGLAVNERECSYTRPARHPSSDPVAPASSQHKLMRLAQRVRMRALPFPCSERTDVVAADVVVAKVVAAVVVVADVLLGVGCAGGLAAGDALQPNDDVAGRGGASLVVGQAQGCDAQANTAQRRRLDAPGRGVALGPAAQPMHGG